MSLLLLLLLGGGTRAQSEDENCFGCGGGLQNQNIRVEVSSPPSCGPIGSKIRRLESTMLHRI
jgi:hypothetical protein